MNWDNLKIFIAVNRYGSVAQAAKHLDLNHSTLLRRLDHLEQSLNLKLFKRLATGYEITQDGEAVLESALQAENNIMDFQRKACGHKAQTSGKIVVSFPPIGTLNVIPLLAAFRKKHPDIELQVDFSADLKDLDKLEAEVIFRYSNQPHEEYVGYEILRFPAHMYAANSYLQQHPYIQNPIDVKDWIVLNLPDFDDGFDAWAAQNNPAAKVALRINTMALAAEATSQGIGGSYLFEHIANHYANLVKIPSEEHHTALWIMTHQDLRFAPRIKSFVDYMRQELPKLYPQYSITRLP